MTRSALISVPCALLLAVSGLAVVDVPKRYVVSPENQSDFGVSVWVKAGVSRCPPATDAWIRLPRKRDAGPLSRVLLKVLDSAGELAFLGTLEVEDSDNKGNVVGGIPDHPLRDPHGFHGVVFCVAAELIPGADVSAFYGGVSGSDTDELNVSALDRWLR